MVSFKEKLLVDLEKSNFVNRRIKVTSFTRKQCFCKRYKFKHKEANPKIKN